MSNKVAVFIYEPLAGDLSRAYRGLKTALEFVKAGDEVASYIANELKGDRADLKLAHRWNSGKITSVVSRKLVTGSKFDVQFENLDARYAFGFAAFDNAQVRHATADDDSFLVFAK